MAAYSNAIKYSLKNGTDLLEIMQFKSSLDAQIDQNIIHALKDEEWLLESVGLHTLKTNNLLPDSSTTVKAKDVYEAFIRFDDKPMIVGKEAVARSLQKYCSNGEFAIAAGDGYNFTRYYFKENVPVFDVDDTTFWLVEKSAIPAQRNEIKTIDGEPKEIKPSTVMNDSSDTGIPEEEAHGDYKLFKAITISGKVPLERYTELFNYFITPFAMNGNKIEIGVNFKIKSNSNSLIGESTQQYKSAKEAAKQLGLDFEEE